MASSQEVHIEVVDPTKKGPLKKFIKMHYDIYRGDPNWVAPLIVDFLERLHPEKNPYLHINDSRLFMAFRDGKPVGRISAHENTMYVEYRKEPVGFFGFFECVDDQAVADALFAAAAGFLKEKGCKILRGPVSHSVNGDPVALLIDGFDSPPVVGMSYNPKYYVDLFESSGFSKIQDFYAFHIPVTGQFAGHISKIAERALKNPRVNIRKSSMKQFDKEAMNLRFLYDEALQNNWGASPWTEENYLYSAKEMKLAIDPDLTFIAEYDGQPAGLALVFKDMNQALIKARGRLLPFGLLKILLNRNKITIARLPVLGVLEKYRNLGIDVALYILSHRAGFEKGYKDGELSWVLESNTMMIRILEHLGTKVYKTYRMYDRAID